MSESSSWAGFGSSGKWRSKRKCEGERSPPQKKLSSIMPRIRSLLTAVAPSSRRKIEQGLGGTLSGVAACCPLAVAGTGDGATCASFSSFIPERDVILLDLRGRPEGEVSAPPSRQRRRYSVFG